MATFKLSQMISGQKTTPAKGQGLTLDSFKGATMAPLPVTTPPPSQTQSQPQGFWDNLFNVGEGVAKSVGQTVVGTARLGNTILQQTGGRLANFIMGKGFKPTNTATGVLDPNSSQGKFVDTALSSKNTAQSVGNFIGSAAQFILPSEEATAATKGMSGILGTAAKMTAQGVAAGGTEAMQTGKVDMNTAITGVAGAASELVKPALSFMGGLLKNTGSILAGTTNEAMDAFLSDLKSGAKGMAQDAVSTLKDSANKVITYASDFAKGASQKYGQGLKDIEQKYLASNADTFKQGNNIIGPDGNILLSLKGLKSYMTSALKNFGVSIAKDGSIDFSNSSLDSSEQRLMSQVGQRIEKWTDISPTGLNRLRQVVGGFIRNNASGANKILSGMTSSIADYLGDRVPEIADLNKGYATAMSFLDEMKTHLSALGNIDKNGIIDPTEFKNVYTKMATLFDKNKDLARALISKIPGGDQILSELAGSKFASSEPVGKIESNAIGLLRGAISPSTIGEIAHATGIVAEKLQPIMTAIQKLAPAERALFLNYFGQMGKNNQANTPQ